MSEPLTEEEKAVIRGSGTCWFCKQSFVVDALIAGYDTFDEQRLACLACNERMQGNWGAAHEERGLDVEALRYDINTELANLTESASQFESGAAAAYHFVLSRLATPEAAPEPKPRAGCDHCSWCERLGCNTHEDVTGPYHEVPKTMPQAPEQGRDTGGPSFAEMLLTAHYQHTEDCHSRTTMRGDPCSCSYFEDLTTIRAALSQGTAHEERPVFTGGDGPVDKDGFSGAAHEKRGLDAGLRERIEWCRAALLALEHTPAPTTEETT